MLITKDEKCKWTTPCDCSGDFKVKCNGVSKNLGEFDQVIKNNPFTHCPYCKKPVEFLVEFPCFPKVKNEDEVIAWLDLW